MNCCTVCPDWTLRKEEDYEAACRKCEIKVRVETREDLKEFMRNVRWCKPTKGIGGRSVFRDFRVNNIDLKQGDRIEPSLEVPDIGQVQNLKVPSTLALWRARTSYDNKVIDSVSHRCPIFSGALHCNPVSALAVDALHTVALGIAHRFVSACIWRVLLRNPWGVAGDLKTALDTEINYVKADLALYQDDPANEVDQNRTVSTVTLKMLGKRGMFNFQDPVFLFSSKCDRARERGREGDRERERERERERDH